jgi:hypothetical protein
VRTFGPPLLSTGILVLALWIPALCPLSPPQQTPSEISGKPEKVELLGIREASHKFLDSWLVQSKVALAVDLFSESFSMSDEDLAEVIEKPLHRGGQKEAPAEPRRSRENLTFWLEDIRGMALRGRELKDILSVGELMGPKSYEKCAVNEIREDGYSLFRYQAPFHDSHIDCADFEGIITDRKDIGAKETFYVTFFYVKLKARAKLEAIPFYALWRKEDNQWRIIEFSFPIK